MRLDAYYIYAQVNVEGDAELRFELLSMLHVVVANLAFQTLEDLLRGDQVPRNK